MSEKVKLNKSELTRLKRDQKTYSQFLPVLRLKQEQLQIEQIRSKKRWVEAEKQLQILVSGLETFMPLLTDTVTFSVEELLKPRAVNLADKSIAGVKVKDFIGVEFTKFKPPLFGNAMWVGDGINSLQKCIESRIRLLVLKEQYIAITKELKKASQKVNLFEKILIPKTKEGIRRIKIALGDEQVAQVGRGKLAKKKTARLSELVA